MTRQEILKAAVEKLRAAGFDDPAREARYVLAAALQLDPLDLVTKSDASVTAAEEVQLHDWLARRLQHEPLGRIKGAREFHGLDFRLNAATLEPRPDSETLVEAALDFFSDRNRPIRILDIGTGSGCLLLSILHEYSNATGIGTDISPLAIEGAQENAHLLGLDARAEFVHTSWAAGVAGAFDCVISNPPYIRKDAIPGLQPEVRLHDPLLALDGGVDGLEAYRALIPAAYALLQPGGFLALEIGQGQEQDVAALLGGNGFKNTAQRRDLGGITRVVTAVK